MRKIITFSFSVATAMVLTTGCGSQNINMKHSTGHTENKSMKHSKKHKSENKKLPNAHKAKWGYTGKYSPPHWGEIKKEFSVCSKGKMQTPINIVSTQDIDIKDLIFNYNTKSTNIINNGHTIQVNIAPGSTVNIDETDYELKQFHFHVPSENNINGQKYALEGHFVHAAKDGKLAVVAVMFKEGKENPVLKKIWSKFPLKTNHTKLINLSADEIKAIMPSNKAYYKFMGSLTTPPCSENVKWNVFKTPMTISKEQVKQFFDIFGHSNNRPIQDTNNRTISE